MTDTPTPFDRTAAGGRDSTPVAGDELLPPVEPPSAAFILQLFVVPAIIVIGIVGIWLMVSWLVHRTSMNPEDLIQGLQTSSVARWQRASELADMLRDERFADFKDSPTAAAKLAAMLDRDIDDAGSDGGMDDESVNLRYFLSRALGEFRVTDGMDVLVKAATTGRDPKEELVRRGALQAIAVRASNLAQKKPPQTLDDPALQAALFQLASDQNNLIRSETAYALGRIATPASLSRLELMLDDPYADARYNAAVALARHGNAKASLVLGEMLDPEEMASIQEEQNERDRFLKRSLIMSNALEAVDELARQNPSADFSAVNAALDRLVALDADALRKASVYPDVVARARETRDRLRAVK